MELKDGIYRLPRSIQEDELLRLEFVLKVWSDLGEAVTKMRLERGDDRYTSPKDFSNVLQYVLEDPDTLAYVEVQAGHLLGLAICVEGVSLHYGRVAVLFGILHTRSSYRLYQYVIQELRLQGYSIVSRTSYLRPGRYVTRYIQI